jgi:hypothetical protein
MTDTTQKAGSSPWARLEAELPSKPGRLLLVGADAPAGTKATVWDPAAGEPRPEGAFDSVVCAGAIQAAAHPANLLLALWEVMPPGSPLLLHTRILTDPACSTFARFVAASAGVGETEWLPGRLALRWTVETNGFDLARWIESGPSEPAGEAEAYLEATRTERTPSLVLATPIPVDGPSQKGGAS